MYRERSGGGHFPSGVLFDTSSSWIFYPPPCGSCLASQGASKKCAQVAQTGWANALVSFMVYTWNPSSLKVLQKSSFCVTFEQPVTPSTQISSDARDFSPGVWRKKTQTDGGGRAKTRVLIGVSSNRLSSPSNFKFKIHLVKEM